MLSNPQKWTRRLLIAAGSFMTLAFLAMLMPTSWMVKSHALMGMGEFPNHPLIQYLSRSASALYGIHGTLYLVMARDVERYQPIIKAISLLNILFGFAMIFVDFHAQMPLFWTLSEGPPVICFGVLIYWLNRIPISSNSATQP